MSTPEAAPTPPVDYSTVLKALTRQQRAVCALAWFDGWEHQKIGKRFGKSRQAVSEMIRRARKRLIELGVNGDVLVRPRRRVVRAVHLSASGENCAAVAAA